MPALSTFGGMSARGFGFRTAGVFEFTITSNQQELNLSTYLTSEGWNGSDKVIVSIASGVYIWSDDVTVGGLIIPSSMSGKVTIFNSGYIIGRGGNGGGYSTSGSSGSGGAGGGGAGGSPAVGGGGGGVGLLGQGSSGAGGTGGTTNGGTGQGGSGGGSGSSIPSRPAGGAIYGGGSGGDSNSSQYGFVVGAVGAVRIIWPGTTRSFPSTNTGNL